MKKISIILLIALMFVFVGCDDDFLKTNGIVEENEGYNDGYNSEEVEEEAEFFTPFVMPNNVWEVLDRLVNIRSFTFNNRYEVIFWYEQRPSGIEYTYSLKDYSGSSAYYRNLLFNKTKTMIEDAFPLSRETIIELNKDVLEWKSIVTERKQNTGFAAIIETVTTEMGKIKIHYNDNGIYAITVYDYNNAYGTSPFYMYENMTLTKK